MKRILLAGAALTSVLVALPMFAAFEAHVVNVTATIANATQVSTNALQFGDVFPQEVADQTFNMSLSNSFLNQTGPNPQNVVDYFIRQKPKCALKTELTPSNELPQYGQVTEDANGNFVCADAVHYQVMPLLCPYLSKHVTAHNGAANDGPGINSFHGLPGPWNLQTAVDTQVVGQLNKTSGNTSDTWDIDLHAPCLKGQCAQDWASYVTSQNNQANPVDYQLDPSLEHKQLGCDLWVEVNGVWAATSSPQVVQQP